MITASRMQSMVQIRKENDLVTKSLFRFFVVVNCTFRALGVEGPRGRAIVQQIHLVQVNRYILYLGPVATKPRSYKAR